jgi:adenylate cyclase
MIEIERKFLVESDAWRKDADGGLTFRQGYLNSEGDASVRVRISADRADINIKAAVIGDSRAEYEYPIPREDADGIVDNLCGGRVVEKTRYRVPAFDHTWEVDVFAGRNAGLMVAEIELSESGEAFQRPDWVGCEVTDDKRYYNHYLAMRPYSEWEDV